MSRIAIVTLIYTRYKSIDFKYSIEENYFSSYIDENFFVRGY
jgi:hypothetical protein